MKLTLKLSLAISLGILLVLGVHTWMRVRADSDVYRADMLRDHAVFARGAAGVVEFVWRRDGAPQALEVVDQINRRESHITIRWVWPDEATGEHAPRRPLDLATFRQRTHSEVVEGPLGVPHMLSYALVDVPGPRDGAIELFESLERESGYVRETILRSALSGSVLVLLCVAMTIGFGVVFVGRPMRKLVDKAQRIGAGNLDQALRLEQNDEVRELAEAMNAMCDRLAEARVKLEDETSARIRAVEHLRHADRLRTVGELASGIAHELGTPLNVVRGRGAMIAAGEVSPERMRQLGDVVVEQADRMAGIIRQLLDYARRSGPKKTSTNLRDIALQCVSLLTPMAQKRGATLRIDPASHDALVSVDASQMQQAVTNLVVNAIHATKEGGSVTLRVAAEQGGAALEVVDDGAGITPDELSRIFEPFYTTKPVGEGTGLGLSIAEQIVREHEGVIDVVSEAGRGARFVIRLPV